MNRYDIFKKNFKWVYRNFNGSYDMNQDPELFADTMKAYYEWSKALPTDKIYEFCKHIASFEKWPSMAQWNDVANRFIRDPEIKTPKEEKIERDTVYGRRLCRMTAQVLFFKTISYDLRMLYLGVGMWYIHKRMKKGSIPNVFQNHVRKSNFKLKKQAMKIIKSINWNVERNTRKRKY